MGLDVSMITSKFIYNSEGKIVTDERDIYVNENGIRTIRLKTKYNATINSKFKKYNDLYRSIELEKPDTLFIHGVQFIDIKEIVRYLKYYPHVKVYVDNHADFSNSATNWLSKNILHKIIWRKCAKLIEPYTTKFYGVLPARVDFLIKVYKIPKEKVELLVMGADDEKVFEAKNPTVRKSIRKKYNISQSDFLIMTGGKIDRSKKQTLLLMKAIKELNKDNIKLIVFGSVADELKEGVNALADGTKVQYIGWIPADDSYNYFGAADLAVFPGRHSVFWEQVAGMGIPMLVKYWEGTTHVDVGGNCAFLHKDNVEEIKGEILKIYNDKELLSNMKRVAEERAMKIFSYRNIAQKSLDIKVEKDIPFKSVLMNEN